MAGYMDLIGKAGGGKKKGRGNRPEHLAHNGQERDGSASSLVNANRSQNRSSVSNRSRRTDRG